MKIYHSNLNKILEFAEDYYIEYNLIKGEFKKEESFGNDRKKLMVKIEELKNKGYKED